MLYVGVDHHTKTSHVTVCDEKGNIVTKKGITSSREGINEILGAYDSPIKAVLEAGFNWGQMYDWLDEVAEEVILAHPLKLRAIAEARIKTDSIDSATLAHLLRADLIPEAYACPADIRANRRALRQRMFMVKVQTMLKNRIGAILHQHSIQRPHVSDLFGAQGMNWLTELVLPEPDWSILREDLLLLEMVRDRIASSERLLEALAKDDRAIDILRSIPGIGKFFSVLIRYEVGDISRFPSAGKFASYTGLIPSTYASGNRVYHGRLTKQGNKCLRWAFIEAVTPAVRVSPEIRVYYERIKNRKGTKDARVATARRIAEITWKVWSEDRFYETR